MAVKSTLDALRAAMPASRLRAVAPHAANNLPDGVCDALWVGGAGDIAIIAEDDVAAVTLFAVAAGTIVPVRAKAVRVAGTTATNIVALY
jgi:hypothetical protein